jgi:glycosyltransferase involved in cell wall biosynthesis
VVVTLGRLAAEKSVDLVLEAVAAVPEVRLAIIGDGPSGDALRDRAGRADLAGRVWFAGMRPRDEALAFVRGGDLFLVASRTETQGLVVAEALAGGLPVVAMDAPGIRDAVRPGIDGVLVPPAPADDAAARLADAIRDLVADRPGRAAMAAAATAGASRFALAGRIAEVIALYRSVIAARR